MHQVSLYMLLLLLILISVHTIIGYKISNVQRRPMILHTNNLLSLTSTSDNDRNTQFVFVGGKGGVGKTSSSSAIALKLSDENLRVLIVSVDPAHSLGDALDYNLSDGKVTKIVTEPNLWAVEVDVEESINNVKNMLSDFDPNELTKSLNLPADLINLDDLLSIFTNLPPGIDEIIALSDIFEYANEKLPNGQPKYERIVIDTAPTGHTLRLLQLPAFLDNLTTNLIKLRGKLSNLLNQFNSFFGGGNSNSDNSMTKLLNALNKLENLQTKLINMKKILKNNKQTQFVIVTIPTTLAVDESKRLVNDLKQEDIYVSSIICNQIVTDDVGDGYLRTRRAGQDKAINSVTNLANNINSKRETNKLEITTVPYVDTEVTSVFGLRFFHSLAHIPKVGSATNPIDSRKLSIYGGKGGVGKTTSAASWALRLADSGMRVLVISTDPAHSLGDCMKESLNGIPKFIDTNNMNGGELWAMEIDSVAAINEFREIVQEAIGTKNIESSSSSLFSGIKSDIKDFLNTMSNPPPGTDEIVAMSKVISYIEDGYTLPNGNLLKFDRIVLDTAPTGHTLRMLKLPIFLRELLQKVKRITSNNTLNKMMGAFSGDNDNSKANNSNRLDKLEAKMKKLDDMLHNPKDSEFVVVTIPTEVANAETLRLVQSLEDDNILCRRIIINQIIQKYENVDAGNTYLNRVRQGQKSSINELTKLSSSNNIPLIQVRYFDNEVRTVYGLRAIGLSIFK